MNSFEWGASLLFALIYGTIIVIPCVIIAVKGKRLIDNLGRFPTKAPGIQMSSLWWLVLVEAVTFASLISFYRYFVFNS